MTAEELVDMKIHEEKTISVPHDPLVTVRRVYGGWIYTTRCSRMTDVPDAVHSVFVPLHRGHN